MKLQFINSLPLEVISGGNIYNKAIIESLTKKGVQVDYSSELQNRDHDATIIDSLIMGEIQISKLNTQKPIIALIHQIPKLDKTEIAFYRSNSKIAVTGEPAKQDLIEYWNIDEANIRAIRPGLPDYWKPKQVFSKIPKNVIIVSNFVKHKGFELLIDIIQRTQHLDLKFHFIGNDKIDPNYALNVVSKLKQLEATASFYFNIKQGEVHQKLIASDVFLNLSESETFGMSIYEALCTGIPCICSKTGDHRYFSKFKNYVQIDDYSSEHFVNTIEDLVITQNAYTAYCNSNVVNSRGWDRVSNEFLNFIEPKA